MYDAIVIGGRCAGAATAMLLARKGDRVLLVERGVFPSDVHQGHFIHKQGPKLLDEWGLLEKVVATGCPPALTHLSDFGDFPLMGRDVRVGNVAWGYGPRRRQLDQVLVQAAIEAGAEFRPNFVVNGCIWDGKRLTGIRGRDKRQGTNSREYAPITIGADGKNSFLAHAVGAPTYEETPPLTCWYFSYWSGVPTEGFEMYVRDKRAIFSFATNDGLFAIFIGWPIDQFNSVRADIERQFMDVVDKVPDFGERVRSGRREERFYGAADLPNFLRRPFGPGWALVGDAGCHKDPFQGLGICSAFRDADFLVSAVHEGLTGHSPLDDALSTYERRRNEATMGEYRENIAWARFSPMRCVAHLDGYLFFDATFQRVRTDGETAVFSEDDLWIPLHLIGRLEVTDDALHFLLLADDWLQDELKSGRLHLTSTQDDEGDYLLAAPSKELKEFAAHFAADSRAFSYAEDFELVPQAGSTSQHRKSNPKAAVYGGKLAISLLLPKAMCGRCAEVLQPHRQSQVAVLLRQKGPA